MFYGPFKNIANLFSPKMSGRKIMPNSRNRVIVQVRNKKLKTDHSNEGETTMTTTVTTFETVSQYFSNSTSTKSSSTSIVADQVLRAQIELNSTLKGIHFTVAPIAYVYNPLEYAFDSNKYYVQKYCTSTKKILLMGMNPGPFGMCQTGVPFGDPTWVKNWLKIRGVVYKPNIECPIRPITGLDSPKKEISGDRFWSFFAQVSGRPDVFFKNSFVSNYCPLAFMNDRGLNVTPSDIKNMQVG